MQKNLRKMATNFLFGDRRLAISFIEGLSEFRSVAISHLDAAADSCPASSQLQVQGREVMLSLAAESPAMMTIGSLNMIGATKFMPAKVEAVSAVIGQMKKARKVPGLETLPYSEEDTKSLNRVIDEITSDPYEGLVGHDYRRLVSYGITTFIALKTVIRSNTAILVVLDWLDRDQNWGAMSNLLKLYGLILPFEVVNKYIRKFVDMRKLNELETLLLMNIKDEDCKDNRIDAGYVSQLVMQMLPGSEPRGAEMPGVQYFQLVSRLCQVYRLPRELADNATHCVRVVKMALSIEKGKWQIAMLQCKTVPLQVLLVNMLFEAKMYAAADRALRHFGRKRLESAGGIVPGIPHDLLQEEIRKNREEYLWFSLAPKKPGVSITVVNSYQTLQALNNTIIKAAGEVFVGVDAEWPAFSTYAQRGVAECSILQIAIVDHVFIVDMQALSPYPVRDQPLKDLRLCEFGRDALKNLFGSEHIIKVGWDFDRSDLQVLQAAAKGYFADCFREVRGLLDLQALIEAYGNDYSIETKMNGLSNCCEYFLGRKLNKFEQLSDWSQRPLHASQIAYAALDAHVLLAVLDSASITIGGSSITGRSLQMYPPIVRDHPLKILQAHREQKMRKLVDTTEPLTTSSSAQATASSTDEICVRLGDISLSDSSLSNVASKECSVLSEQPRHKSKRVTPQTWRSFIRTFSSVGHEQVIH